MEDSQIVELYWQRNESAIDHTQNKYGSYLAKIAYNILNDREDSDESVNDTYLAIWNVIPPKRPEPLAPFVYRTGRNIALNRLRANTALKRSAYEMSLDELSGCIAGPDLWETVDARELGRQINAFLATISRENRVIFLRRYWFGDSVKDIAADLQLAENTVSVRLSRLRDKLRSYLSQEGFYE
jgi:RNA polymerase sigma-70 factor (ECF subfamily)